MADDHMQIDGPATVGSTRKEQAKYPDHWKKKNVPAHLKPLKFNSTSSLYIDSTISKPKNTELMHCIADYFWRQIKPEDNTAPESKKRYEIFDETKFPLTSRVMDPHMPTDDNIQQFIKNIFKIGQLAHESLIMAVAYLNRIRESHPDFVLTVANWRRMILSCLILASKVWEDQAVWNVDFLDLFPLATPHDLGQLEKKLLSLLSFDVSLKASQYAQIYFDLRAQSHITEEHFTDLQPLTKEGETQLELRSQNYTLMATNTKQIQKVNIPNCLIFPHFGG